MTSIKYILRRDGEIELLDRVPLRKVLDKYRSLGYRVTKLSKKDKARLVERAEFAKAK